MAEFRWNPNAEPPRPTGAAARMAAERPWLGIPPGYRIAQRRPWDHFRASDDPERHKLRLERDI